MSRFAIITIKRFLVIYLTCLLKLKNARKGGFSILTRKRLPVALSIFLTGISFACVISSVLSTPKIKTDYLHEHLETSETEKHLTWVSSDNDLVDQDKVKIGQLIAKSEKTGSISGYKDFLKGQALDRALEVHCMNRINNCVFPLRLNRRLVAEHINQDFRVANIKETSLRVNLQTSRINGDLLLKDIADETRILRFYQTQAGWIQNNLQTVQEKPQRVADRTHKFAEAFSQKFVGLNYYPATASWRDFWVDFPIYEITSDLVAARDMNVNAVRIFLNHDYFDGTETQDDAIEKLKIFLDLCENYNIQVLITLFDLRPNYELSNWSTDIKHIDAVLSGVASHPAILGVDLKNQPDLDFKNWGEGRVEAWLTVMARHVQINFPQLAVTAGWSTAENALRLKDVVDVITYHEYQNPERFKERLNTIKSAAYGKPVMITELGSTTWHPPFIQGLTENSQASRLREQLGQASQSDGIFVWTLNDFDHVGREVVGPLPWRQAQQRHFGLRREDGSFRPSAEVLKKFGAEVNVISVSFKSSKSITTQNSVF